MTSFWRMVTLIVAALGWMASPSPVLAENLAAQVADDFSPLAATVVKVVDDGYLIDLDDSHGVAGGDLFAVTGGGESVLHPVTGKVLGVYAAPRGYVQVSLVLSGLSQVRPLGAAQAAVGDSLQRFTAVPALFRDATGTGEVLYLQIKEQLPHLQWRGYEVVEQARAATANDGEPLLLFHHLGDTLEVRDGQGQLLRRYARIEGRDEEAAAPPVAAASPASSAVITLAETPAAAVWKGPFQAGTPVGIEVADLDGDGSLEMVVAYGDHLEISRLRQGHYEAVARVELPSGLATLAVDGFDLNGDGRAELYVSAVQGGRLASVVVAWEQAAYAVVEKELPWFFRKDDDGRGHVRLLGQRKTPSSKEFDGPLVRLARAGSSLIEAEHLTAPAGAELLALRPFSFRGETLYAELADSGQLRVLRAGGERLWWSERSYGGSETSMEYPSRQRGAVNESRYLKPRLLAGPDGSLLVPANHGGGILEKIRRFKSFEVKALRWNGMDMAEVWGTQEEQGYLADFRLADADNDGQVELVMAVGGSGDLGVFGKRQSRIVLYELP
ncbi:VCBS repeat-containing protein [Desulfuromonas sp. AOP6]|uniref:FG-GAP repeat domain-containing protein n=1 Tax=Desulfuromonas sp. AOP6 TaxID=1566351 RepID=UPI001278D18B|nr:VCBS repeat-containing protein [Desulfuromonas sp. AOP6]BCA81107.1 hypothetical protein AOP6_2894 [Desulfuromonas sp. AOP6]